MCTDNRKDSGFTLIELMIAMAIAGFVLAAIYGVFASTSRTQSTEQIGVEMQQDIRAGFQIMQMEIRRAGFDASLTWGTDGIDNDGGAVDDATEQENRRRLDSVDNDLLLDFERNGGASLGIDGADADGETLGIVEARSHLITFSLVEAEQPDGMSTNDRIFEYFRFGFAAGDDTDNNGIADAGGAPLARSVNLGGLTRFIENTHAVAFAYAFDAVNNEDPSDMTPDGLLEVSPNGNILWAFDSTGVDADGDGYVELDRILDDNDDGVVDESDTAGGVNLVGLGWAGVGGAGAVWTAPPESDRIQAVRIWLLVRSRTPLRDHTDNDTYVVGPNHIVTNDNFKRRLLTSIVKTPNLPAQN